MIEFEVYGEIKGKGRPRFRVVNNKFVHTYTDSATASFENLVKLSYLNSNTQSYMEDEALCCEITVYTSIPKSISQKKRVQMLEQKIRPTKKPDIDNIQKAILDSLNKVAYKDDSQIVTMIFKKYYGETPKAIIKIWEEL